MNSQLLTINTIAGIHYTNEKKIDTVVVYGRGAPLPPDNGTLLEASVIINRGMDVFVPDYIGYGRSEGKCTPQNCIKTFLDLYASFTKGCVARNFYQKTEKILKYGRVIFIGRSFGGTYVPLLPRYTKEIRELALIFPVVDSKSCGTVKGEETNEDFLGSMEHDGYRHLYRGILSQQWKDHLENKDDLSPMENIGHLDGAKLFIAHGKKDRCVNYTKSAGYYQKIIKEFPDKKDHFRIALYPYGAHNDETAKKAVGDFLNWIG